MLIATALVVAIRTARWGATASTDPLCSDVQPALDKEVAGVAIHEHYRLDALRRRIEAGRKPGQLFELKAEPIG